MGARDKVQPKFEESLERLEQIVEKLENGETSLDESIKLFQEGRKLGKQCSNQLAAVEKKAQLLIEKEDGSVTAEPFEGESSGGRIEEDDAAARA